MADENEDAPSKSYRFHDIDFADPEIIQLGYRKRRKSTVICTLSDPSITQIEMQRMMEIGMNAINFKLGNFTHQDKLDMLEKVQTAARACSKKYSVPDWPIATCMELKTCTVKTGLPEEDRDSIPLEEGSEVLVTNNIKKFDKCNETEIFIDCAYLKDNAKVGNYISIRQDDILLKIKELINNQTIKCVVIRGGNLFKMENVAMKGIDYAEPLLSTRDYDVLHFCIEHKIDMIIINYVRSAETLKLIKQTIKEFKWRPLLFAAICTSQCLSELDYILPLADGIILCRDVVTYEVPPDQTLHMARIQKWVCAKCSQACKSVYISGGVLAEGVKSGIFYDSEIIDFTNALFDGATGFVISDCLDADYTHHTLIAINDICKMFEPLTTTKETFWATVNGIPLPINSARAAAISCLTIANYSYARAIILPTVSGVTARCLMDLRPGCLVYTVSTSGRVLRRLAPFRCVIPLLYDVTKFNKQWKTIVAERTNYALEFAVKKGLLQYGDNYVTLFRGKDSSPYCDTIQMWTVSIFRKTNVETIHQGLHVLWMLLFEAKHFLILWVSGELCLAFICLVLLQYQLPADLTANS